MTEIKDPKTVHNEDINSSDGDVVEKGSRRASLAGGHTESLAELDDPDAGKTAEERAKIVWKRESSLVEFSLIINRTSDSSGALIYG